MRAKTQSDPYREADRSTAGRLEVPGTKVMRLIMCLVLGTLSLGTYAQDAFYIYRNDGDFNGFFYDEVQEMRYSKLALDSTEQEQYVTYEVVLADTIYRIPLTAIDSIGFQQPEIRFNPKAHFLVRDGYEPFLNTVKINGCTFKDLPSNLPIQVGDVLIGLPSDPRAETLYINTPGNLGPGSFACVVDGLKSWEYNGSIITEATGHPVDKLSDVFEQYITVEQVTIDKNNQVHRRIAGCDENGMPRKALAVGGEGDMDLFTFQFNLTREWQPSNIGKIDLNAEIELKDKLRVAYDISLFKFYAKITNEMRFKIKRSVGLQLNASYEATSDDWAALPHIMFPAACPIFETNPTPMFFFRVDGTAEARLNLPAVKLGIGTDFILNSANIIFPVAFGVHFVPDESSKIDDDMLDFSAAANIKAMVQTGIKFQMNIATASWFKKLVNADLGLHLYTGPKLSTMFTFNPGNLAKEADQPTALSAVYTSLQRSNIFLSLLSVDLEAKAKASAFGKQPVEKKFFDTNVSFLNDTVFFVPTFDSLTVDYDSTTFKLDVRLFPRKQKVIGGSHYQLAERNVSTNEVIMHKPVYYIGINDRDSDIVYSFDNIRADGKTRHFFPVVLFGSQRTSRAITERYFSPGVYFELDKDSLVFGAKDNLRQQITIHTNVLQSGLIMNNTTSCGINTNSKNTGIKATNAQNGEYTAIFEAAPNSTVFDLETSAQDPTHPWIRASSHGEMGHTRSIGMYQGVDLSNVELSLSTSFRDDQGKTQTYGYKGAVTVTPYSRDSVHVEGTYTKNDIANVTTTYTVSLDFVRKSQYNGNDHLTVASGSFSYHYEAQSETSKTEIRYDVTFGGITGTQSGASGTLQNGSYKKWKDGEVTDEREMGTTSEARFTLTAK